MDVIKQLRQRLHPRITPFQRAIFASWFCLIAHYFITYDLYFDTLDPWDWQHVYLYTLSICLVLILLADWIKKCRFLYRPTMLALAIIWMGFATLDLLTTFYGVWGWEEALCLSAGCLWLATNNTIRITREHS